VVALGLNGENDGDGVGRPGADLDRVRHREFCGFVFQAKGGADGAGQLRPVELERGDVIRRELSLRTDGRGALAVAGEERLD